MQPLNTAASAGAAAMTNGGNSVSGARTAILLLLDCFVVVVFVVEYDKFRGLKPLFLLDINVRIQPRQCERHSKKTFPPNKCFKTIF